MSKLVFEGDKGFKLVVSTGVAEPGECDVHVDAPSAIHTVGRLQLSQVRFGLANAFDGISYGLIVERCGVELYEVVSFGTRASLCVTPLDDNKEIDLYAVDCYGKLLRIGHLRRVDMNRMIGLFSCAM